MADKTKHGSGAVGKKCRCRKCNRCLHCGKPPRKGSGKWFNRYCGLCWDDGVIGFAVLRGRKKCIVLGCDNMSDRGVFEGDLCMPCHGFITRSEGQHSQAYRNSLQLMARKFAGRLEYLLVDGFDPTKSILGQRGNSLTKEDLDKLT